MNKQIFSLALVASLTACGGGGSSSSSNDDTTDPVDPAPTTPEVNYCEATDNVILLAEGQSCRLTEQQMVAMSNLSSDTDIVACEDEKVRFGILSLNSLTVGTQTVRCDLPEPEPVDTSAFTATSTDALIQLNEEGDNFFAPTSISVVGNTDVIQEDAASPQVAQIHSNLLDGAFSLIVEVNDQEFFENSENQGAIALNFLPENQTKEEYMEQGGSLDLYILRFDETTLDNNKLTIGCSYSGNLSNISCADINIDLSSRFESLPARGKLAAFSCELVTKQDNSQSLSCKNSISVPVQFN